MNIMRFREKLKAFPKQGILKQATVDILLRSPVFLAGTISHMSDIEVEWCEQHVLDETKRVPKNLPFPVFSILYSVAEHAKDNIVDQALIVWGRPYSSDNLRIKFALWGMMKVDGIEGVTVCGFTGQRDNGLAINTFRDGIETTQEVMSRPASAQAAAEIGNGLRNVMLRVVFDIMNPANVILRVTPNAKGRSVQWVESRTHYCIINKTHAARCLRDRRGPTETEIQRSAHWRRAHMRRLMSDKFTHKKGQLVFVKQSWVGPEEWEGTDKKIYKVINTTNSINKT